MVKPWIRVESCPGLICQTLCGVPGFWFSSTIGLVLVLAAFVTGALASKVFVVDVVVAAAVVTSEVVAGAVVAGAVVRVVCTGGMRLDVVSTTSASVACGVVDPDDEVWVVGADVKDDVLVVCSTVVDAGLAMAGGVLEPIRGDNWVSSNDVSAGGVSVATDGISACVRITDGVTGI